MSKFWTSSIFFGSYFKNAEADDSNESVKKEKRLEHTSQNLENHFDDDSDILDGFLQGYNETGQQEEGK